MPLDPQAQTVLELLPKLPETNDVDVALFRAEMQEAALLVEPIPVTAVAEHEAPGPAGPIRLRWYRPSGKGPFPALVFFHGGGFVLGSLDSHDPHCRRYCTRAGCVVVAVDYRLAPEHPFPAAPEDGFAAIAWIAANSARLEIDPARLAVGGDSAGGNLATVVSRLARDRGGPDIAYQVLVYPVTDWSLNQPSYQEHGDGYFLTRGSMRWFRDHYLPRPDLRGHPHAAPLRAPELADLPPALILTAEFDPLRDEGEAYGRRLREAGVSCHVERVPGLFHGFFGMGDAVDRADAAVDDVCLRLRRALET